VNKHSVFYSQGFRKNQLRNNFGVFLTFFKVVLVLFVQKWKVKNIAFKPNTKTMNNQTLLEEKNSMPRRKIPIDDLQRHTAKHLFNSYDD
jgi:hypothetical protein